MLRQNPGARGEHLIIIFKHFYPSCSGYGVSNSLRPFKVISLSENILKNSREPPLQLFMELFYLRVSTTFTTINLADYHG